MLIPIQNLKLEEEKKRLRNLDPWKTHYQPVPKDREREGNQSEQTENQTQNFLLQHIHHLQQQSQPQPLLKKPSRLSGKIVPVHGGHIVRSTGQKDRHSKVHTAKGLRDRRVRLSAHTAIQFYDIQDRLGYDRPSKAVDWLIKNAKAAIDQLDELPSWKPNNSTDEPISTSTAPFSTNPSSDLPGLLSRTSSHAQDLRLSLQSFQDATPNIFSGSAADLPFDSNSLINPWNVADNMFGHNQFFTQREPLQSSNLSLMRTWSDQVDNASGNQMHHSLFHQSPSVLDIGFGSSSYDFSGFRIPMRIQNEEEHDGGISDSQNSASASHY